MGVRGRKHKIREGLAFSSQSQKKKQKNNSPKLASRGTCLVKSASKGIRDRNRFSVLDSHPEENKRATVDYIDKRESEFRCRKLGGNKTEKRSTSSCEG